jgi:hypothetical protein
MKGDTNRHPGLVLEASYKATALEEVGNSLFNHYVLFGSEDLLSFM